MLAAVVAGSAAGRRVVQLSDGVWEAAVICLITVAGLCGGVALYLAAVTQMRPSPNGDNWDYTAYRPM